MQIQACVFRVTDDKQKLTSVAVYDTMRSQFRGRQLDYSLEWTTPYRDFRERRRSARARSLSFARDFGCMQIVSDEVLVSLSVWSAE